jgi:hypothetical protein
MSIAAAVSWALALILFVVSFWIRRQRRVRGRLSAPPVRPSGAATPKPSEVLVWINADGSARELADAEKKYVDTEFSPFDGARPYIKSHHAQRNGWGELSGYLQRKEVPDGVPIDLAPSDQPAAPNSPRAVADSILELIRKPRRT